MRDLRRCVACAAIFLVPGLSACNAPAPASREPAAASQPATPNAPPPSTKPAAPDAPPSPSAPPTPTTSTSLREVFPHVRVDATARLIEIDGSVPIDAHDAEKPRVYLEVMVCTPDTKEHETVIVTKAKPSHVHAALLLIGADPGKPGAWNWAGEKLETIPPTGARLNVTATFAGSSAPVPISDCAISTRDSTTLTNRAGNHSFVFAGSRTVKKKDGEVYWADGDGTLMGLTTFGGETIAWTEMFNPDASIEQPHWIANKNVVPAYGTAAVVTIKLASE